METLIHADIFFFITTIFVALLSVGVCIALFYIVPVLKDFRHLSARAREEGDRLVDDIHDLRTAAREEGTRVKTLVDYFLGLFIKRQKNNSRKVTRNKEDGEKLS